MEKKLVEDLGKIIEANKDCIPIPRYMLWKNHNIVSLQELFQFIIDSFEEVEEVIKNKMKRKVLYEIGFYETGMRKFAISLARRLIPEYRHYYGDKNYIHFFQQKIMSYAFFYIIDLEYADLRDKLDGIEYVGKIYLGLIRYYNNYYSSFLNNEEAIRLLCKYYYVKDDSLKDKEIIRTLYRHIRNAGTPANLNYAPKGIKLIEENIQYLPPGLIEDLLQEYRLYDVLNQKIYRHQIFAIINGSRMDLEIKRKLKFFYIDSLVLVNIFNLSYQKEQLEHHTEWEEHYFSYDEQLNNSKIFVFDKPIAYWEVVSKEERQFVVKNTITARIRLRTSHITFDFEGRHTEEIDYNYNYWALESFYNAKMQQKIHRLISGNNSQTKQQYMTFSLLYLNHYRGITKQVLEFDHRFCYNLQEKRIERKQWKKKLPSPFYGKDVYSLSCIVGRNGTGKTSIIDFLRETFYKLIIIIRDFDISCEQGYVKETDYRKFNILDKEADFLVAFHMGDNDYFLTNMKDVTTDAVEPYRKNVSPITNEFCKLAYFSQQLRTDQWELFDIEGKEAETGRRQETEDDIANVSRTLQTIGQCDYSELNSYLVCKKNWDVWKEKAIEQSALRNREICYQFTLLRNLTDKEFCEYMDIPLKSCFHIYSMISGKKEGMFFQRDCRDDSIFDEMVKKYAQRPDVRIGFFSSGQYAKFNFLAKLYWFLVGYHRDIQRYLKILGNSCFARDNALQHGETALIFIDEGELYYHPEWQRRFVATLLSMIRKQESQSKLQIVFTTNSPFIISDVLKEDIKYLPNPKENMEETLGQNIHVLLKNNFYMDYTIGEYSREIIDSIIRFLNGTSENIELSEFLNGTEDTFKAISTLIEKIGEPVYRDTLKKMLMESQNKSVDNERKIEELEKQKRKCQDMIDKLKEGNGNGTDRTI